MSSDLAGDFVPPRASRAGVQKVAIVAAKLLVTGACFWYVSRQVDWRQTLSTIPLLDWRWAALAPLIGMLQVPLLGLRWRNIVEALAPDDTPMTRTDMIAATAVGMFFAQVLPSVAGEVSATRKQIKSLVGSGSALIVLVYVGIAIVGGLLVTVKDEWSVQ